MLCYVFITFSRLTILHFFDLGKMRYPFLGIRVCYIAIFFYKREMPMCNGNNAKNAGPMVFIEGNVGVGKSTFLHFLHETLKEHVFYEPSEQWQDVDGYNLLEQFFLDQKRWAYTLQSYVLLTRVDQMILADTAFFDKICLVERSVYSGLYCFAAVAKEIGTMNGLEWALYKKLWDREVARIQRPPAGFIYLRTPAQVCYERIMKRGRHEENPITMDYLQRIEQKHEDWFIKKQGVRDDIAAVPNLILDFSPDLVTNTEIQQKYIQLILKFIQRIQGKES